MFYHGIETLYKQCNLKRLKEHLIIPSNGNIIPELIKFSFPISKSIEC